MPLESDELSGANTRQVVYTGCKATPATPSGSSNYVANDSLKSASKRRLTANSPMTLTWVAVRRAATTQDDVRTPNLTNLATNTPQTRALTRLRKPHASKHTLHTPAAGYAAMSTKQCAALASAAAAAALDRHCAVAENVPQYRLRHSIERR